MSDASSVDNNGDDDDSNDDDRDEEFVPDPEITGKSKVWTAGPESLPFKAFGIELENIKVFRFLQYTGGSGAKPPWRLPARPNRYAQLKGEYAVILLNLKFQAVPSKCGTHT